MDNNQRGDLERRVSRLEVNDEKIFTSLEQIKDGQHNQNLVNQKMNFTLDSINREREIDKESKRENRKNIKEMKRLMLGMVFSVAGSIIFAIVRMVFGI